MTRHRTAALGIGPTTRRGFTLIELLVVIVVISILIALLIPVIAGAVRNANDARVAAEIQLLSNALAEFKNKYGDYPPSRIVLSEIGAYPLNDNSTLAAFFGNNQKFGQPDIRMNVLAERSVRFLRKFFPSALPPDNTNGTFWHDFNGNGIRDTGLIYLEGDECLVFFLGGIPVNTNNSLSMSGFGKDPARPFTTSLLTAPTPVRSENRMQPFFEFSSDRLIDEDGDGMPSYLDPYAPQLTVGEGNYHVYVYFSGYGGNEYDPNDVNFPIELTLQQIRANVGILPADYTIPFTTASPAPNPYTSSTPTPSNGFASFINPNGYQIISSGADGYYGPGGTFLGVTSNDKLPFDPTTLQGQLPPGELRSREKDNITNFTRGRID